MPYQQRPIQIPQGFQVSDINYLNLSDAEIDNMWTIFLSCYANLVYSSYEEELKKGCRAEITCEEMYLMMGLYALKNWYNNQFNFTFPVVQVGMNPYNVSIALEAFYGDMDLSNPIVINIQGNTYQELATNLQNALGSNYIVTLSGSDITITVLPPFPTSDALPFLVVAQPSNSPGGFNLWFELEPFNPYISLATIQSIIENLIQICGRINCKSSLSLFNDNNFVSLPIIWNVINDNIQTYPTSQFNKYLFK